MHNLYVRIVKFGQYRLAIWSIPVGDLANTGWRFGQYRRRYILAGLRSKSGILKTWELLELCLDMGSIISVHLSERLKGEKYTTMIQDGWEFE